MKYGFKRHSTCSSYEPVTLLSNWPLNNLRRYMTSNGFDLNLTEGTNVRLPKILTSRHQFWRRMFFFVRIELFALAASLSTDRNYSNSQIIIWTVPEDWHPISSLYLLGTLKHYKVLPSSRSLLGGIGDSMVDWKDVLYAACNISDSSCHRFGEKVFYA